MEKLSINEWNEKDRPREKFAAQGPEALSSAELLAILIGSGSTDESAVALMQRVLADHGNSLGTLGKQGIARLCEYKGMGPAKAITVLAACELGRRRTAEAPAEPRVVRSSRDIYDVFLPLMRDLPHEECRVLLLSRSLRVISEKCIGRGGISEAVCDVRLVLESALLARASCIALCHNHPSGHKQPSGADDALTVAVRRGAEAVGMRLVDHIILTDGDYYSYNDEGRL